MTGRRALLLVALVAVLLGGGATGVAAQGATCEGGVVGVVGNETLDSATALHGGSVVELGVCTDGSPSDFDAEQLAEHPGYEVVANPDEGRPTVRITGDRYPVNFSALHDSASTAGLVVEAPAGTYHSSVAGTLTFASPETAEAFNRTESAFLRAAEAHRTAAKSLGTTADGIRPSGSLAAGTVREANDTLTRLATTHEWVLENATRLSGIAAGMRDPATASYVVSEIETRRSAVIADGAGAVDSYQAALGARRGTVLSTVLTYFGGALAGGVLLGIGLGAAIPLKQARNVEKKLRLSRNVQFEARAAVIPALVGLVLVIGGVGLLWWIGGGALLGVFL
ncbi:MAG: hypothetical protein ABEJ76_03535 [Halanaeroarchaeum sp.]